MADVGQRFGAHGLTEGRYAIGVMFQVHRRDRYNYRETVRSSHDYDANRDAPALPGRFENTRR